MQTRFIGLAACLGLALLLAAPPAATPANAGTRDAEYPLTPKTKGGKPWRVAYYEGGQYPDYAAILKAIVRGLAALNWMEPVSFEAGAEVEGAALWRDLATKTKSRFIEFVPDAYYTAGNFDPALRPKVRAELIERLKKGDIDLVIAMGTWAGQDLATNAHRVPTVVASTSDPVAAGIVKGALDSGLDHVHAKVELGRYQRQVELFHDLFQFKRLGIVYEESREGRTFGGVDAVEEVARARGFEVVRCNTPFTGVTRREAETGVAGCYGQIAEKADAVYITVHQGVTLTNMPRILAPLNAKKLPSFSMLGSNEVKHGVLLGIAQGDFSAVGRFHAETIARIFNGAKPRDLEQRWVMPPKLAINLKTAALIGYVPPPDIMLAADEVFQTIEDAATATAR